MKHEIEITIKSDGIIESEVLGISGPSCEGIAAWLDQLGEILVHKKTADSYKGASTCVKKVVRTD